MTLTLILMRHAKSDHPDGTADHDRPLTDGGRDGAAKVGRWLEAQGIAPDEALVSTATRTWQTWEGARDAAGWTIEATPLRALYNAPEGAIRSAVGEATGRTVLVIGHNPAIGSAAGSLARAAPAHGRFGRYPPAAATILHFEAEGWAEAMKGSGHVMGFAVPADL
jgi:phosphohistidine phosphatase